MLEQIYNLGLEKFAGDESQARDFLAGFIDGLQKEAAQPKDGALEHFVNGVSGAIGKGAGGLAIATGFSAVSQLIRSSQNSALRTKFLRAMETAIRSNRILSEADHNKVMSFGETIFNHAPTVATDPNLLGSILTNAVHGDSIDPMTIRMLSELEGRHKMNNQITPRNFMIG